MPQMLANKNAKLHLDSKKDYITFYFAEKDRVHKFFSKTWRLLAKVIKFKAKIFKRTICRDIKFEIYAIVSSLVK